MAKNLIEAAIEKCGKLTKIVEFPNVTLDDDKPVAVKLRNLRMGDYMAVGDGHVPIPSGKRYDDWEPHEKKTFYNYLKELAPIVVAQMRHVAKKDDGTYEETWIDIKLVDREKCNNEKNEITIGQVEEMQVDALYLIGNSILFANEVGGEIETLPNAVQSPEFRVERGRDGDAGVDGGDVREDAARTAVEST